MLDPKRAQARRLKELPSDMQSNTLQLPPTLTNCRVLMQLPMFTKSKTDIRPLLRDTPRIETLEPRLKKPRILAADPSLT